MDKGFLRMMNNASSGLHKTDQGIIEPLHYIRRSMQSGVDNIRIYMNHLSIIKKNVQGSYFLKPELSSSFCQSNPFSLQADANGVE